jgi:ferredoxin
MKVRVDSERCQGHTLCSMIAPDSFELSDIDGSSSPWSGCQKIRISVICLLNPATEEFLRYFI